MLLLDTHTPFTRLAPEGGTEIDDWLRNDTITNCMNASGFPEPNRPNPDNGALWNGMVAPFINYTIFGALWYQGEVLAFP
jgi:sialate O-acetylesterase